MLIRTIIEGERNNKNRKKRTTRTLTLSHYTLLQLLFVHRFGFISVIHLQTVLFSFTEV